MNSRYGPKHGMASPSLIEGSMLVDMSCLLFPILTVILVVCKSVWGSFPSTLSTTKLLYRSNIVHSSLELVPNQPLFSFTPATTRIIMNTMVQNEVEVSVNTLRLRAHRTLTRTNFENCNFDKIKKGVGGDENLLINFNWSYV